MKIKAILFFSFLVHFCYSNMASPIVEGSKNTSAFSSKNITILHENIIVHISNDFKTAKYTIEYTIKSEVTGAQIPLLFLAQEYKDNFIVWLDGNKINTQNIPNNIIHAEKSQFEDFMNSFPERIDGNAYIPIRWQPNNTSLINLDDLKYFEANLLKGEHKIKVEYTADVWVNNSNWVKEYSFRYSLSPAKYWKSFGSLHITIFQDGEVKALHTNLGNPIERKFGKVATWKFNSLPSDNFNITYKPEINETAKILFNIEPFGLMLIFGLFLMLIHISFNYWFRQKDAVKKISWIVILGSFIVPYLMLHCYFLAYDLIDNAIGKHASKHHGYYFLILFWYPFLVAIYLFIMWIIDLIIKRKFIKKQP
jgi:hypothetical protein